MMLSYAQFTQGERGLTAAVIELDPLTDPVRAAAEDHDPRLLPTIGLVGKRGFTFVFVS
jgi:hypothetical protein